MNENIKELAERAGFGNAIDYQNPQFNEKFAQLIIQECIVRVKQKPNRKEYLSWLTSHFGVEHE